jgi:radical SAM protein (TIGR04043 family)
MEDVKNADIPRLKADLLTLGVKGEVQKLRGGGGGIAGIGFKIKGSTVSAPPRSYSPYEIINLDGEWILTKNGDEISKLLLPVYPKYYRLKTREGIPYNKYVALDGLECLVTSLSRKCVHWSSGRRCSFCSIQHGNPVWNKDPETLAEIVLEAYREDKNRHLVMTSGTFPDREVTAKNIAEAVRAIKERCDIPIQVQLEPIRNDLIEEIYAAGADSVGFNAESFDPYVRAKHVPAKKDLKSYMASWNYAIELFGENQVSSWIILGLGERENVTKAGLELIASIGVIPFVAPLNPPHVSLRPPDPEYLIRLSKFAAEKMKEYGLSPKKSAAGCIRCGGCSLIGDMLY